MLQTNTSSGSGPEQRTNMHLFEGLSGKRYNTMTDKLSRSASSRDPAPSMKKLSGKNLDFFQVPKASIEAIGSGLAMKIFDEYANILRCIYRTRFSGGSSGTGSSTEDPPIHKTSTPSLIRSLESGRPDKFRRRTRGSKEGIDT